MTGSKISKNRNLHGNLEIRTRHGRTKGFNYIRDSFVAIGATVANIDKTHPDTTQHDTAHHNVSVGPKMRLGTLEA